MHLPKITNPFHSPKQASGAQSTNLQGMPLHQRKQELTKDFEAAKQKFDGMKPDFKNFRFGSTPEHGQKRTEYNAAGIRFEQTKWELDKFTGENKPGLKAEAKAGPSAHPSGSGDDHRRHPASLSPGNPASAPQRQEFHPELFFQTPPQPHNHPTALIPGHPDSAPKNASMPSEFFSARSNTTSRLHSRNPPRI